MKITKIECQSCGANIRLDDDFKNVFFCPYCGSKYHYDDGTIRFEITENKNIRIHKRIQNDAEILKQKNKSKEWEYKELRIGLTVIGILVGLLVIMALVSVISGNIKESKEKMAGNISAGSSSNLVGKDYETVIAQLKAAGFNNIEEIDLEDYGIFVWNNGKVAEVSIGGKTSFGNSDYFSPDSVVVVSYH